jgi:NADH-quinone oxidoreductase subunit J
VVVVIPLDAILFYALAAVLVASALVVVGQRNPIYSAFALVVTFCALSAIYALLGSPFIAVLQIVVYAGAIMVLFLFVLMLLNVQREEARARSKSLRVSAGVLALAFVAEVGFVVSAADRGTGAASFDASTRPMAMLLFSPHFAYTFLATAILILAALVGAVVLAKKDLP